jgi:orotidine-5'-phosphate decarboxylase
MANVDGKIPYDKSIIISTEISLDQLKKLVDETKDVKGIGGYKVGMQLGLTETLAKTVATIKERTELPVIFDYQKAGNDIPDMGKIFATICKDAQVDSAILFPFAGAATVREWIKELQDKGVNVMVGAHMTHPEFLWSEGGIIHDDGPARVFEMAAQAGVKDFVVPGTKLDFVEKYKKLLDGLVGEGTYSLYSPGFVAQGGSIADMDKVAGNNWHAIVGRGIYAAEDMRTAAEELTRVLGY